MKDYKIILEISDCFLKDLHVVQVNFLCTANNLDDTISQQVCMNRISHFREELGESYFNYLELLVSQQCLVEADMHVVPRAH